MSAAIANLPLSCAQSDEPDVSVVFPCLNEEQTIGRCIEKAQAGLARAGVVGEIIVADNGSTDRSVAICHAHGVRVIRQPARGYGNAYRAGIAAARGRHIIMADSDDTYDLTEIDRFLAPLHGGADLVMGNRFAGRILPGAMTWSHRYIGNPVLSALMRLMFDTRVGDSHSGIRAFSREAYDRLGLRAPGMEYASEMVINASRMGLRVTEVPITYYPREGESKLHTLRDGWRHLRYMLLRSPTWLFILPGLLMVSIGGFAALPFLWGTLTIAGRPFDIHALFLIGLAILVGYQLFTLGIFARLLGIREGLEVEDRMTRLLRRGFRLERGLLAGLALMLAGGALGFSIFQYWVTTDFGPLLISETRLAFLALIAIVLGVQTMFSSFHLICVLGIHTVDRPDEQPTPPLSHGKR